MRPGRNGIWSMVMTRWSCCCGRRWGAGGEGQRQRLPGVMDSFMQWCESVREDFKLGADIDRQLAQRPFKAGVTQTYREWRAMARMDPAALLAAGFKDDPAKGDGEELRLELNAVPGWAPGRSMRPPKPGVITAVLGEAGGAPAGAEKNSG